MNEPEPSPIPRPTGTRRWELPPLILHPFSDKRGPETLLECSRAQLMLAGVLPLDGVEPEVLEQRVVEGRACEVKMLYYVGLDLNRWLEECTEVAARDDALKEAGLSRGSFASLLAGDAPSNVEAKLQNWGVTDYRALFSRALGLNAVFACAPDSGFAQSGFLLDYHRYADALFRCWREKQDGPPASAGDFAFELYASGEYSRILEREWEKDAGDDAPPP